MQFPSHTVGIGDTIGWFPYVAKFEEARQCSLICAMQERMTPLFRDVYPEIALVTHQEIRPERYYRARLHR